MRRAIFPTAIILAAIILNGRETYYIMKYAIADLKDRRRY
jgi:hypothetical protein